METRTALFCLGPAANGALEVRQVPRRRPAADEVEIAVEAASVNPIDVRRTEGYGVRLLSLLGAGKFPMVLGNDFAGTVVTTGTKVAALKPGERVYGLKRTSGEGTHASSRAGSGHVGAASSRWSRSTGIGGYSLQLRDDVARGPRSGTDPRERGGKESACARGRWRTGDISTANVVRVGGKNHGNREAADARRMSAGGCHRGYRRQANIIPLARRLVRCHAEFCHLGR